ncbi:MAG: hypothetical protein PHU70_10155 [Dehalococcoidia bacterium]|nr:hypothetical protein [Dehalococcoidia bacterium]MDD5647512.1 hypothetical protein [Dehalococcoidia bacterium]
MDWLVYLACIAGGAFLVNAVPHFVAGISGRKFHSPFASPPVKGLSSAVVNVIWGLVNFIIAYALLIWAGACNPEFNCKTLAVAIGAIITSIALAVIFSTVDKNLK